MWKGEPERSYCIILVDTLSHKSCPSPNYMTATEREITYKQQHKETHPHSEKKCERLSHYLAEIHL